ncbi:MULTISPECIES: transposase [Idiomarina]|jgi:transposase-like protein|uniref:transposase n=1 Tax=Idiomarina TaxID=135575 RepID=UPI0002E5930B|nr:MULTISPECIES: transposase [unclassified Idiomarina]NWO04099.1 transposase [Idiomarinaceae bacterium]|tara:strand:+ start:47 stop:448 length:402 start_codon:yes stop_codon:yes gene_type:complete
MPKPVSTISPEITPAPEHEKRTRRTFSVEYKLDILRKADACQHGELGQLLRRENLYSNQLAQWRREFSEQGVAGLSKSQPGPQSSQTPEQKRIEKLEKENQRLQEQLRLKDSCLDLQKKAFALIDQTDTGSNS